MHLTNPKTINRVYKDYRMHAFQGKIAIDTESLPVAEVTNHRHQILQQLLENKKGLCIDNLALYLNISRTAVQQHFRILEKEGLIRKHDQIKTNGRPLTRYVLTELGHAYFPKQYQGFSVLLLQALKEELGSEKLVSYLTKLGERSGLAYRPQFEGKLESEQIQMFYDLLQERGFHVSQGLSLKEVQLQAFNCIYHDIVQQFPEMCAFDIAFMKALLPENNKLTLNECMAKGGSCCCFKIKKAAIKTED